MKKNSRLDNCLVVKGIVETRSKAQALIMAGKVFVNGVNVQDKSAIIQDDSEIFLEDSIPYVSRGGKKLAGALEHFSIAVAGRVCLDVGASTGGFTDCLVRSGASLVFAVDVGHGQLDWKLRRDPKVVIMEKTNIRYFTGPLEPVPDLAVIDVSFISLEKVIPAVSCLMADKGEIIALVKPQFEAPRGSTKKGVIKDEVIRRAAVEKIIDFARGEGLLVKGDIPSVIKGGKGNVEYFVLMQKIQG